MCTRLLLSLGVCYSYRLIALILQEQREPQLLMHSQLIPPDSRGTEISIATQALILDSSLTFCSDTHKPDLDS